MATETAKEHLAWCVERAMEYADQGDMTNAWEAIEEKNFAGEWTEPPADALLVLLAHSDCDGVIHPQQAGPLADRLAELLPLLPDEEGGGHIGHWHTTTQRFIDGLRTAAEAGEEVVFA